MTLSYYAVAFLDLLGQTESFRELRRLPENDAERSHAEAVMGKTGRTVRQLRAHLELLVNRPIPTTVPPGVDPARLPAFQQFMSPPLIQRGFSDSFVVAMKLPTRVESPDDLAIAISGIHRMITSLAGLMLISLSSSVPLRGGFDVQVGMDLYPDEVYGPVLESAYRLESDAAEYPRIVVGDNVLQLLHTWKSLPDSEPGFQLVKAMVQGCGPFLTEDHDGHTILHCLSPKLREAFGDEEFENRWGHARQFIVHEIRRHRAARNGKLWPRYMRLYRYFDALDPNKTATKATQSDVDNA